MAAISESTFESVRRLLQTRKVTEYLDGSHLRPDPAYMPLLALFQETKPQPCEDLECFADGRSKSGARRSHLHPESVSRFPYWLALPLGAPEGALIKVFMQLVAVGNVPGVKGVLIKLDELLWRRGDTRQDSLLVVEEWMKEKA